MMRKFVCIYSLVMIVVFFVFHDDGHAVSAGDFGDTIMGRDGGDMVLIPEGNFYMGSEGLNYPEDERPRHKVHLGAYYIDRHEVTNAQFAAFLNAASQAKNPDTRKKWVVIRNDLDDQPKESWFPTEIVYQNGKYVSYGGFDNVPVIAVSWFAANEYCNWYGERLPSEAEWEKAARGGLEEKDYPWGNQIPTLESGVIFGRRWKDNSLPPPVARVDNYPSNGYGIFGMAGNVSEWCSDWYGAGYYKNSPVNNPLGPNSGQRKVQRGGSWVSTAVGVRAAARGNNLPSSNSTSAGFRCVKDADKVK